MANKCQVSIHGSKIPAPARTARFTNALFLVVLSCLLSLSQAEGKGPYDRQVIHYPYRQGDLTVIGRPRSYTVGPEDTFLDIARKYELGFSEMAILYPRIDPWMPPAGKTITIPSLFVLPQIRRGEIVINIPEMRLYFFEKSASRVQTYPVSIGRTGWETPTGRFFISEKRKHPTWYVPASLQEKYGTAVMPPGPENPLGEYIMRFSDSGYSMHGTHMPWGVGRLVSHGCIRCYPEHMRLLYPQVPLKTPVALIYEPIKFGRKNGRVFVEVHPDVYDRIPDFRKYAAKKLAVCPVKGRIDPVKFAEAVRLRNGMPVDVTVSATHIRTDDGSTAPDACRSVDKLVRRKSNSVNPP